MSGAMEEKMLAFSANLSMLFTEVDFLDRFTRAHRAGFRGVECQFPYAHTIDDLVDRLQRHDLVHVLHNLPAGNWSSGERGIACLPDRIGEFQDGVGQAIEYAKALDCKRLNCLAGIAPPAVAHETLRQTFVENLRFAARELKDVGIRLLIEPLNGRDVPGFFLQHSDVAIDIITEVSSDNVSLQYDVYHMQIMEGDLAGTITRNLEQIGHIQIADSPGRHEPGTGGIDYPRLFACLERVGYQGWIGCEYSPRTTTEEGLTWLTSQGDLRIS